MNGNGFFEKLVSEVPKEFVQVAEFFNKHFSSINMEFLKFLNSLYIANI